MRTNRLDSELHCFAILQYRKGWSLTMAMRVYCSYKARCKGGTPNALENGDPCVWNPTGYHSIFWQVPLQLKIIHRLIPGYEHYSVSLRASICDAGISNEISFLPKPNNVKEYPSVPRQMIPAPSLFQIESLWRRTIKSQALTRQRQSRSSLILLVKTPVLQKLGSYGFLPSKLMLSYR